MTYYAQLNSHELLVKVDLTEIVKDSYDSTDVQNYEVAETEYLKYKAAPYKYNGVEEKEIEVEIEVPDYDEEGNPIIIEYEETETVIDYDEEGNPIGTHEITVIKHKQQTHTEIITKTIYVLKENPNWKEEQAAKREAQFNAEFFQTSLGYIRRSVTMANGTHKDFLSDLLPAISASVSMGQSVNLIAYDKPPFDEDITDWTPYQHIVQATPQFIQECFIQLGQDFLPINTEEE